MRLVTEGDDDAHDPCGPRIMWPNALVLEALLLLGYEDNERVQTALGTLLHRGWCECGYQHGTTSGHRAGPLTMDEIAKVEELCIEEFRCGGTAGIRDPERMDQTSGTGVKMPRVSFSHEGAIDTFLFENAYSPAAVRTCDRESREPGQERENEAPCSSPPLALRCAAA